jgi:prepilin-type processing-associated H-X9-DG protein
MEYMSLDFSVPDLKVYRIDGQRHSGGTIVAHADGNAIWYEHPSIEPGNAIAEEHRAFVASILDGAPAIVSLSDGIAALRLAAAIEQDVRNRMELLQLQR